MRPMTNRQNQVYSTLTARFAEAERPLRIEQYRTACVVGAIFMIVAYLLDLLLKSEFAKTFLVLRLVCSALMLGIWWLVSTSWGRRNYIILGLLLPALPATFISYMIYLTDGPASSYYAGLNTVLVGAAIILRWGAKESAMVVTEVMVVYICACLLNLHEHGNMLPKVFWGNLIFMGITGVFVVVGSYYLSRLRLKDFEQAQVIKLNLQQIEASNRQLNEIKTELEVSNSELTNQKFQLEQTLVELRQTQDQLVTKEKQASLGVWSAGIIHEMNNPLNFARTGLYALRDKYKQLPVSEQEEFKEVVADIEEGVRRVHTIVSDLRTFAHPGQEAREDVQVTDVLRVALRFFSGELQGNIEVIQNIHPDQTINADRNKLVQVVGNLLQNSVDALKSKQFDQGHPCITIEGRVADGRSRLSIRDNGPGIERQHLDKIFDPFFTTKDVGQGMGLGLGICYRIVQEFGGTISVQTEPGEFCEFVLDFPIAGTEKELETG